MWPCDGEQASRLAFETSYDAIVLDVMLPGRDGMAVCRQIRARGALTPILLLTAMDAVDSRIQGLDSGADDYLTKPFAFGELLARLRAIIRRGTRPIVPRGPHHRQPDDRHAGPPGHPRRSRDPADGARVRAARILRAPEGRGDWAGRYCRARLGRSTTIRSQT